MAKSERSETKLFDGIRLFSIRLYRLAGEFDMCAQVLVSFSHIYGCNQSHPMTHLHLYTVRCTVQELKLWCWIFLFFLCCCLTIAYLSNCFHLFFFSSRQQQSPWLRLEILKMYNTIQFRLLFCVCSLCRISFYILSMNYIERWRVRAHDIYIFWLRMHTFYAQWIKQNKNSRKCIEEGRKTTKPKMLVISNRFGSSMKCNLFSSFQCTYIRWNLNSEETDVWKVK